MSDDLVSAMNELLLIENGLDEKLAHRVCSQWKAKCEELSTLRARVREVVGPFAEFDHATTSSKPETCVIARGRIPSVLTLADFEAARQLMKEVK